MPNHAGVLQRRFFPAKLETEGDDAIFNTLLELILLAIIVFFLVISLQYLRQPDDLIRLLHPGYGFAQALLRHEGVFECLAPA